MKKQLFTITENTSLTPFLNKMVLKGDTDEIKRAGQFINIAVDGFYLRRPLSVFDKSENTVSVIFKKVGKGTISLGEKAVGDRLDVLTGLGNGYDTALSGDSPLLIGGGVGIPPLYLLAKELISERKKVTVIMGFNTKEEIFCEKDFRELDCKVIITTVDGSYGIKGFVTDAMDLDYSYFYTCGPEPMLKAVYKASKTEGQFSFEERMGCGFGACMGCSCKTVTGYKRICKDGPVLKKEEILW